MRARVLAGVLILVASGGCATMNDSPEDPARADRPAGHGHAVTFVREDGMPNLTTTCQTPLIDLQDKSTIQLVRVLRNKQGDYSVAAGQVRRRRRRTAARRLRHGAPDAASSEE